MAIELNDIVERIAESALAGSATLSEWCQANCGAKPVVSILFDPNDEDSLKYSPYLAVIPAIDSWDQGRGETRLAVDVWCRVENGVADMAQGTAGTGLRTYKAAAHVLSLARQVLAAIETDLEDTNVWVAKYAIERFNFIDFWPIVQCIVRVEVGVPDVIGAEIELEVE